MGWIRINDPLVVNPKRAAQVRRTHRGYRLEFGHPSLAVTGPEGDPAYAWVQAFVVLAAAADCTIISEDNRCDRKIGGG